MKNPDVNKRQIREPWMQDCQFCKVTLPYHKLIEHEELCRKKLKICDGYGNCKKQGLIILSNGRERTRWCKDCFARFKQDNPNITIEVGKIFGGAK